MAWTEQQLMAMNARNCDMLVAAAAGSGKTAVLVERIFNLVCEGADIERMLIVTFTNAVAAEMRERLALRFDDMADDARMREQAQACRQAHIQTLHSFCRDVCRAYFQAADVDPGFRIMDQQEAQLVQERALEDALLNAYEDVDEGLARLNALRGPDALRGMVLELHRFLSSRADAGEWLNMLMFDDMRLRQREEVARGIRSLAGRARRILLSARRMADEDAEAGIYLHSLERDMDIWPDGSDIAALAAFSAPRLDAERGSPKGASSQPGAELVKLMRKRAKETTASAQKLAGLLLEDDADEARYMSMAIPALVRLEKDFEKEYDRRKRERSALDFDDLEHRALKALRNEGVMNSVRGMFDYVFVDEYQDISHVQESILNLVSPPRSRFMVGDVKQSIYRFRQADPSIFLDKYDRFDTVPGGAALRIDLNKNFRSRANVLNFVNGVFSRSMSRAEYEIEYDDSASLKAGLPVRQDDPAVELHILGAGEQDESNDDDTYEPDDEGGIEELTREESEARVAAGIIKQLIGTPMLDQKTGEYRSIQARDIVVLSRAIKSLAPKALEVLLGEGIPAYADAAGGYFDTMEVRQVLELMRIIDNRLRDYDLLGVMHSPMFGFDAAELGEIRARTLRGTFAEALEAYAAEENQLEERDVALLEKTRAFISALDTWQSDARSMPLGELMWQMLDETGYYVYVGALPGGLERQANLRLLGERAAAYEDSQFGGLHGFLQYVEQMKHSGQDMTTAATLGESDNVVRIMSVHKSKGLEFPVVIGINLGTHFRKLRGEDMLINGETGLGMYMMDEEKATRRNTVSRQAASLRLEREQLAEELRVLYVLLTRARDRLVLIGSVSNAWKSGMLWRAGAVIAPMCMLDWIMPASMAMMESGEAQVRYYEHPARGFSQSHDDISMDESIAKLRADSVDQATYDRMTWRYPHQQAVLAPLKLTASNLGRELEGPAAMPECLERPLFMSAQQLNAVERGIATHTVMQWLELDALRGLQGEALSDEIGRQLDALKLRGTLTSAQRRGVRQSAIARFFSSNMGARMLRSARVEREWPFNLRMSVSEAIPDAEGTSAARERMLVQGVIDCCFEEDGGWVLIDYKTDRDDDMDALREKYRDQLELYARALREITGMPVRQMGLFLLRSGEFLDMTQHVSAQG